VTPATVKGIGIAIPGQIDRAAGTVVSFPHVARWAGTPVAEPVGAAMGVPCRILPNAPSVALGEREFGLAKGVSHALCIGVAENVTMGIVCNGEVVFGCSGNAGELGHIALGDPAERCYCGATGCLETAATTLVLVREARRALADGVDSVLSSTPTVDAHYIIDAARKNDRLAVDLVEAMIQRLAGALVVTVNIFNPEVIILNGVLSDAADLFMDSLQRIIHRSAVSEAGAAVTLKVSELGGTAGALGATIPIVERVFAEV
jgi:N-acetylglucosamine repressor